MAVSSASSVGPYSSTRYVLSGLPHSKVVDNGSSQYLASNDIVKGIDSFNPLREAVEVVNLGKHLGVAFGNQEEVVLQQIVELEERDGVGQCRINALDNACQVEGGQSGV